MNTAEFYQRCSDLEVEIFRKRLPLKLHHEQERLSNAQTVREVLATFSPNCAPQLPKSEEP